MKTANDPLVCRTSPAPGHAGVIFKMAPHTLCWQEQETILVYDGEGRLYSFWSGHSLYRRGLDSRVLEIRRAAQGSRLARNHRMLSDESARKVFGRSHQASQNMRSRLASGAIRIGDSTLTARIVAALDNVLTYDPDRLALERHRFEKLYRPISVLPPDQYMALVVQLTYGCPYNQCTFCDLYRDREFRVKSADELIVNIRGIKAFLGKALSMRKGLFLGDGNSLSLPTAHLLPLLTLVRREFADSPVLQRGLFSFADVRAVLSKSADDLALLQQLGVKRIYLGLESGSEDLLRLLQKPSTQRQQLEAVARLAGAGIGVGVVFLAGVGGRRHANEHVQRTIDLVNRLPLRQGDLIYVSRFYPSRDTPYWSQVSEHQLEVLTDQEVRDQMQAIRKGIDADVLRQAKFAPYDLEGFIY